MITSEQAANVAPMGFTDEEWETFYRDGIVKLPTKLTDEEIGRLLDAAQESIDAGPTYDPKKTHRLVQIVEKHPAFTELIDHPRHIGYAYDVFGEQIKLMQSDMFYRPKGSYQNDWHCDGPRVVPFRTFAPDLPLKMRVGYWLTDQPRDGMGNFVYVPGSHRDPWAEYPGKGSYPGEQVLTCERGSVFVFSGNIWHRVSTNDADLTRITLFITYCPSWVVGYEFPSPGWVSTLNREQRIIVRPYGEDLEAFTRPPKEDLPLYLDRDTMDENGPYVSNIEERHKRRRLTLPERQAWASHSSNGG